ncbi:MAG TPA: nuclear transport factor 2 family protein [Solirubrobacteraceae bacterium]|nr:nuclear transport factor 2 family protein [Solirubrobacteraceae bacterium]
MHPFRQAVEAHDLDAFPELLAEHVTFLSPVAFQPYEGRALVAAILRGASRAFKDFHYVREINDRDGREHALMFKARVGDREVHGCDFLHHDDDGLIGEFCVMVRPLSGARALADEMARQFEIIKQELSAQI